MTTETKKPDEEMGSKDKKVESEIGYMIGLLDIQENKNEQLKKELNEIKAKAIEEFEMLKSEMEFAGQKIEEERMQSVANSNDLTS